MLVQKSISIYPGTCSFCKINNKELKLHIFFIYCNNLKKFKKQSLEICDKLTNTLNGTIK